VELKISQAVRKRIDIASLTCRELIKTFQKCRDIDLTIKNSYADVLALITDESTTLLPALSAFKEQFIAIGAVHQESASVLEQECITRASSMMDSFVAQTRTTRAEIGSHVSELQVARALCEQTYSKQDKAMMFAFGASDSAVAAKDDAVFQLACNPDLDPWLSTVAHEASVKGVETLSAKQQDCFNRGVNEVLAADDRRIEATKTLLLTFLQNEKQKLQAQLDGIESLFDCVQSINPRTDAQDFLSHYSISEADLSRNKAKEVKLEGGAQPPDMGVWVPDDSVKVCSQVRCGSYRPALLFVFSKS
jgi:hypothetical protein